MKQFYIFYHAIKSVMEFQIAPYRTFYRVIGPLYFSHQKSSQQLQKGAVNMRGYYTASGYYGLMDGKYILFASESDYYETARQDNDDEE